MIFQQELPEKWQRRLDVLSGWLTAGELDDGAEVSRLMRRGQMIVLIGFVGLGLFACFVPVDGAVVANGVVKVSGSRQAVQHAEGGIVAAIWGHNGDVVKAGDVLVELKDLRTDAGVGLLDAQWIQYMATGARLRAERVGAVRVDFPQELLARIKEPDVAAAVSRERQLFETRRQSLNESLALYAAQEKDIAQRIAGLEMQVQGEKRGSDLSRAELDSYEKLADTGAVSQAQLLATQRRQADYDVRVGEHMADIAAARQSMKELELRADDERDKYREAATQDLVDVESKLIELREKLRPTHDAAQRLQVRAPVDGVVVNSKVHTVGGVIGAGDVVMEIVPVGEALKVEAHIPIQAISQVTAGQEAHIQFTSFRQRITPMVAATVTYVSADLLQDAQSQAPYYEVDLVADMNSLRDAGIDKLLPGMPAVAYMKTRPRTLMEYLLEPVTDTIRRGFREQ